MVEKVRLNDINLLEILNSMENTICKNRYSFKLDNGYTLIFTFDVSQLPHLMGLHKVKFKDLNVLKGNYAIDLIKKEIVTTKSLKKQIGFENIRERYRYFPLIQNILETPTVIKFNSFKLKTEKIIGSGLFETEYMLYSKEYNVRLFLSMKTLDTTNMKIHCLPNSFFPDDGDRYYNFKEEEYIVTEKIIVQK